MNYIFRVPVLLAFLTIVEVGCGVKQIDSSSIDQQRREADEIVTGAISRVLINVAQLDDLEAGRDQKVADALRWELFWHLVELVAAEKDYPEISLEVSALIENVYDGDLDREIRQILERKFSDRPYPGKELVIQFFKRVEEMRPAGQP